MLNADEIADFLPHGRGMSLIEKVIDWQEQNINCIGLSHKDPKNPMFANGNLQSITLIEYAAQSVAVHAGLLNAKLGTQRPAYIGGLKKIEIAAQYLPDRKTELRISATAELLSAGGAIYKFSISSDAELILSGRLTLVQPPADS